MGGKAWEGRWRERSWREGRWWGQSLAQKTGSQRWLPKRAPQRLVGPDGGARWWGGPKQPIEVFGREVGKGSGKRIVWWGEVGGEKRLEEVGGPKAWREKGSGREKAAPPPYTLCRPPPLLKARVEGRLAPLARARGGARHWRHLLPPPPSRREEGGGLCLKEKRPWAHTAQSLMPSG